MIAADELEETLALIVRLGGARSFAGANASSRWLVRARALKVAPSARPCCSRATVEK